jgi:dTMP kinase
MLEKGKFGVIEGNDGTGKTVQTKLLVERLGHEGFSVSTCDFPQYGQNVFADDVKRYLEGKYGDPTKLDPFIASMPYACDRHKASAGIRNALAEGKIVVANRYASANMGHQGGKYKMRIRELERAIQARELKEERARILSEQEKFFSWLKEMEFGERGFGIPYPDLTVILNLDPRVAQQLKGQQRSREGAQKDGHESNLEYLEGVSETFRELAQSEPGWRLVECGDGKGGILKPEVIHEEVWELFKEMLAA